MANTLDIKCDIKPYLSTWWISDVDILGDQYSWYQMWYQNDEHHMIKDILMLRGYMIMCLSSLAKRECGCVESLVD